MKIMTLIALACVACSTGCGLWLQPTIEELEQNPLPVPDFISFIHPQPNGRLLPTERLCVMVRESIIWRPGDEGVTDHIVSTLQVIINGQPYTDLSMFSPFLLIGRWDEDGNLLGSHDGDLSICTEESLQRGMYVATIRTESTAGEVYSYSWTFRVEEVAEE